jgi:Zn-dependent peptidase ImmA (M78 family)
MNHVGDVILATRRAAGMTQEQLAAALDITQAALSRYENNLRDPDPATLERLAEALGVSQTFLTHRYQLQGAIAADAHMRRQKTTKASAWKHAEAQLNLLRMRSSFLLDRVSMTPQNQIPSYDPDDTLPESAARLVRAQWKMPIGPVRDLTRWLESAGIIVVEQDFGTHRIDGLSQWAAQYPVILVNSVQTPDRRRMTLAHELGHLVLHSVYMDSDVENQANAFAAEFLMPAHVIGSQLTTLKLPKLMALKEVWGVSMQALYERAFKMGKVTAAERTSFYRSLNAKGWKTQEPGSEKLPRETPNLARSFGESLIQNGLTRDEVARLTGASEARSNDPFLPALSHLRAI